MPVHYAKRHAIVLEDRSQGSAYSPLFGPDLDTISLHLPAVTPITPHDGRDKGLWIRPCAWAFGFPRLVHDPVPGDKTLFPRVHELRRDAVRAALLHRLQQFANEQLIADRPHRCRLNFLENAVAGVNQG